MVGKAGKVSLSRRAALAGLGTLPFAGCERQPATSHSKPLPKSAALPPPVPANAHGLIEIIKLDPSIRLDIHYARANNFTGQILYPQARAFLAEAAADALVAAHISLKPKGLGLTIFDGYRPAQVTKLMWDVTPRSKRDFVANPKDGSRHNRGCAVDLTLHDLGSGRQIDMPSAYDEFTKRAHHDFMDASPAAIANRVLLRDTMKAHGFYAMANEWWHYDYKDWRVYPLLDVPFEGM